MPRSLTTDGFRLEYDRAGAGPPVLLLHGWPGDRTDFRALVSMLLDTHEVLAPDLRGFGESDKLVREPADAYSAAAQTRSLVGLLDELRLPRVVVAGYDIGSRIAQTLATQHPDRVSALVVSPPLPGIGARILDVDPSREFWYQSFHQLDLVERLVDGRAEAVRVYLEHFWTHWSGPSFTLDEGSLARLVRRYGAPGALVASIAWYRAGAGAVAHSTAERAPAKGDRIHPPATVLLPEHDPLFPPAWADRLDEFFADVQVLHLPNAGHFTPLEAPQAFAEAITAATDRDCP
ncbi:MAG: alpha/beta hydrolase [Kutzneria sp.]|nr:alpha/beta hydrolase [Kutzneria sp.]